MLGFITGKHIQDFFIQLLSYYKAGINLSLSVSNIAGLTKDPDLKKGLLTLKNNLDNGMTLNSSLLNSELKRPIKPWELVLIRVGEESGDLEQVLELLINIRKDNRQSTRNLIGRILYPVILFHLASVILNLPIIFMEGFGLFLLNVSMFLGSFYLIAGIISFLFRIDEFIEGADFFHRFLLRIGFIRNLYLSRFFNSLGHLFDKNLSIYEVFKISGQTTGNSYFGRKLISRLETSGSEGMRYSELLKDLNFIDSEYISLLHSGEESGNLEKILKHLSVETYLKGREGLNRLTIILPVIIFLIIAGIIGYRVITAFADRFNQISNF